MLLLLLSWAVGFNLLVSHVGSHAIGRAVNYFGVCIGVATAFPPLLADAVFPRSGYCTAFDKAGAIIAVDITLRLSLGEQ